MYIDKKKKPYRGEWFKDEIVIKSEVKYPNGDVFVGENVRNGYKTGQGHMTYANGDQYKGTWLFDRPWHGRLKYAG